MLLVANAQDAAIAPGGERIAFVRPGKDGFSRVWTLAFATPEGGRESTGVGAGHYNHRYPAWSPDGRLICYEDVRDLWLVPAEGEHRDVSRMTTPGTRIQPSRGTAGTSTSRPIERAPARSWRLAVAGGAPVRVTRGAGPEDFPSVSQDGRRLALLSSLETLAIALFDVQTGGFSRVEQGRISSEAAFAPDKSAIAFVSTLLGQMCHGGFSGFKARCP